MFDHRGWGRSFDTRQDGVEGDGSLVGSGKGFLKSLFKHCKSCHAELMGLLMLLVKMFCSSVSPSYFAWNIERSIHPFLKPSSTVNLLKCLSSKMTPLSSKI